MPDVWQLWGTFATADHTKPHPFVSDVLVYDRLLIPTPDPADEARWADEGRQPELQAKLIEVLADGNEDRVLEVPWNADARDLYERRRADLASSVAFDVNNIASGMRTDPQFAPQGLTRMVLADYFNHERDEKIAAGVFRGLPPTASVDVVAAYDTVSDFEADTGASADPPARARPSDLLGGFVWPFLVPAEEDRSDLDLLKRAVEFANMDEIKTYRNAFHAWRAEVVLLGLSSEQAAARLRDSIDAYDAAMRRSRVRTITQGACLVFAIAAGVGAALLPVVGLPILGASLGAGAALSPGADKVTARLFHGQVGSPNVGSTAGALFWEARRALR